MKLDRSLQNGSWGKYAALNLRKLQAAAAANSTGHWPPEIAAALYTLEQAGILDWGAVGSENEFFLMRLKDQYSKPALEAYANAARTNDPEYADEVLGLANRSGKDSPFCKLPD